MTVHLPVDEAARLVSASADPACRASASTIHFFDPTETVAFLSGNLPHWRQAGAIYFVTFRLADALPQTLLKEWLDDRDAWHKANPEPHTFEQKRDYCERFPAHFHTWLDQGFGSCLLADPPCSRIVEEVLRHFDGVRYRLGEHMVMPNHVHVLVTPFGNHQLSEVLHTWKSFSAHEIVKTTRAVKHVSVVDEAARLVSSSAANPTCRAGASTTEVSAL